MMKVFDVVEYIKCGWNMFELRLGGVDLSNLTNSNKQKKTVQGREDEI